MRHSDQVATQVRRAGRPMGGHHDAGARAAWCSHDGREFVAVRHDRGWREWDRGRSVAAFAARRAVNPVPSRYGTRRLFSAFRVRVVFPFAARRTPVPLHAAPRGTGVSNRPSTF
jgi:hypothetical protein